MAAIRKVGLRKPRRKQAAHIRVERGVRSGPFFRIGRILFDRLDPLHLLSAQVHGQRIEVQVFRWGELIDHGSVEECGMQGAFQSFWGFEKTYKGGRLPRSRLFVDGYLEARFFKEGDELRANVPGWTVRHNLVEAWWCQEGEKDPESWEKCPLENTSAFDRWRADLRRGKRLPSVLRFESKRRK